MAFSKNHRTIVQLKNIETNGFADLDGTNIRDCADLLMTPADTDNTMQNAKNISSTFGNINAWLLNVASPDSEIASINTKQILNMYLYLADAPYKGYKVEYLLHAFDSSNPIDNKCIDDLRRLKIDETETGLEKQPDCLLQLLINGWPLGMYYPKWKTFIPGAGFRETHIYGMTPDAFMEANPHVTYRCRAILTNMLNHGSDSSIINKLLNMIGGPMPTNQMATYTAELATDISSDVSAYILATSPAADPAAVCGYMGTNQSGILLDAPTLVNTGTAPIRSMNRTFKHIGNNLVIIPPVQNASQINKVTYDCGPLNSNGIPSWIEFRAEINNTLYHHIYAGNFKTCQPENYIDLFYMVPDGILAKHNYLVQGSSAGSLGLNDTQTYWKVYPDDPTSANIVLNSVQYDGTWEINQRSTRIDRMELCDAATNMVLGTIIPEKAPAFKAMNKHMFVSLDPAGTTSVRLKSIEGTGVSEGLTYNDLIYPITPMSKAEFDQTIERRTGPDKRNGTHFDSLLQTFSTTGSYGYSNLMVDSRIWKPDEADLFEALKTYPGTMTEAMTNLGVISNMKEFLTRSNLKPKDRQIIVNALKSYIGIMLLESILSLAREGYSVNSNNLELLISYPENGSGEGITKQMKDIIKGALSFINEYMDNNSQLTIGVNVSIYSESEAAALWHEIHPAGLYMGGSVSVGSPDIGHSTHDFSLRVNGNLFMFSIPYAAQKITAGTLAKVYADNPSALMHCFNGGSQELKKQAHKTLIEAMDSNHGKLSERLGFILTLNRLFSNCTFNVTGVNADVFQMKVQELTEAKLNIAIPAYAYTIVHAIKNGDLGLTTQVIFAPVGMGSLALNNTAPGFKNRFTSRLYSEINYLIRQDEYFPAGTEFTGRLTLTPNNDKDKMSVAQGMIDIKENGAKKAALVSVPDATEHYLDLVYGSGESEDTDAKQQFRNDLDALSHPSKRLDLMNKKAVLYADAFNHLIENYDYDRFSSAFERFGYTGIDQGIPQDEMGILDDTIRDIVKNEFNNLCAELQQQSQELIMSCPFVEEEMICGALIDLAIDRMPLFNDYQ